MVEKWILILRSLVVLELGNVNYGMENKPLAFMIFIVYIQLFNRLLAGIWSRCSQHYQEISKKNSHP